MRAKPVKQLVETGPVLSTAGALADERGVGGEHDPLAHPTVPLPADLAIVKLKGEGGEGETEGREERGRGRVKLKGEGERGRGRVKWKGQWRGRGEKVKCHRPWIDRVSRTHLVQ